MDEQLKHYCLMCPGPVNVSPRVLEAMVGCEIGHREEEFSQILCELRDNCLKVMGLSSDEYAVVCLTGSGSAGNEAVLCSAISATDSVLALYNGEFGRRLSEISSLYNPQTQYHEQPWGSKLDLAQVEALLASQHFDWVTMVHHETSTGELQPVEAVGALCKKYGAKLFVDAVSSFMADPLDISAANITMMTTSSGKAVGMVPGLALVVGKRREFERLSNFPARNYYLNLARHYKFHETLGQTPNTPAISLFVALNEALRIVVEEGVQERFKSQSHKVKRLRDGVRGLGLSLLHEDRDLSNAVSSICLPAGMSFEYLRTRLREQGYIVYGGKGPLQEKIFQVSTMGCIEDSDIDAFLAALELCLSARVTDKICC